MKINFEINTSWINPLIVWTKARALERSTWEGIIGASTIIASWINPEYYKEITSCGASLWSLLRIVTKDATSTLGKALEAASDAHDELVSPQITASEPIGLSPVPVVNNANPS